MALPRPWTSGDVVVHRSYDEYKYGIMTANTSYALEDNRYWTLKTPTCLLNSYAFPLAYNVREKECVNVIEIPMKSGQVRKLTPEVAKVVIEIIQAYDNARQKGLFKYDDPKLQQWLNNTPDNIVKIWARKEEFNNRMWPTYVPPFLY